MVPIFLKIFSFSTRIVWHLSVLKVNPACRVQFSSDFLSFISQKVFCGKNMIPYISCYGLNNSTKRLACLALATNLESQLWIKHQSEDRWVPSGYFTYDTTLNFLKLNEQDVLRVSHVDVHLHRETEKCACASPLYHQLMNIHEFSVFKDLFEEVCSVLSATVEKSFYDLPGTARSKIWCVFLIFTRFDFSLSDTESVRSREQTHQYF